MTDSADIKTAADRLQRALRSLEGALDPLLDRVSRLEVTAKEAETMSEDRAALAAKLDESKSLENSFKSREKEFNALADETTRELDRVIKQVRSALGEG